MADPAEDLGDQNRSLSPMARFAAADPQVTGVLQDIVQSLKRLEGRLEALEGRRGPGPAPDEGVGVLVPLPALPDERRSRRKRTKKKKEATPAPFTKPARTPGGVATPKGATVPPTGSRAGPLGPVARTPKAASGKKVAITPKRVTTTPGAKKGQASAGTAPMAETAGASSKKGGKKVGKGVGIDTPTPVPSRSAIRARPPMTPTTPSSAARPADKKTSGWKTARRRKKAAKPAGAGVGVPPSNQPPGPSRRVKKAAIRKRLPRTAAVGVTVVSVGGAEASKVADVMRKVREGVPSLLATFGIKELRPKRMANGGTLLEIPGVQAASQADALAQHIKDRFP